MFAAVTDAAFPVFALILTGWLCAKVNLMPASVTDGLNRFVIYLALPAQLFGAMSHATLSELVRPGFFLAYGLGMLGTALCFTLVSRNDHAPVTDRIISGMSATYSNAGFMGIPLCLMVFGPAGLAPSIICTLFTVSLLFAVSILCIELNHLKDGRVMPAIRKVVGAMLRNPLLLAPIAGIAWSAMGKTMPTAVERFVDLIGAAATPCALIAIGLFLAQHPARKNSAVVNRIVLLKLLVQPAQTGVLVFWVFDLPRLWSLVAVLSAALPVGTGPFMLAQIYQRDAAASARAILLSTVGSVLTISLVIAWIGRPTVN